MTTTDLSSSHSRRRKRSDHVFDQDDPRFKNKRIAAPFIRKANISAEKLATVEKLLNSRMSEVFKEDALIRAMGHSLCCVCRGIPTYEVVHPLEDAVKIERYCDKCVLRVDKKTFQLKDGVYL